MSPVDLNRRFVEWREENTSDPELYARFSISDDGTLGWQELLTRRRVVVLAEAGSGKTEELKEKARQLASRERVAVYATVEDVGREGLRNALHSSDRTRLDAWLVSHAPGWLFIDSVDEARLNGVQLRTTLRKIAEGITGAEGRTHVVLSGRYTDWEFIADLDLFNEELPIPKVPVVPAEPSLDELIVRMLDHHELPKSNEVPPEVPLVVIMTALDAARIRTFAAAKRVTQLDEFLRHIESANLWRFARRPLDLDWLVDFWITNGRFGTLADMLNASLNARVAETNRDRARSDDLDETRALRALERIGAALVFGKATTLALADRELSLTRDAENAPLDIATILPDWSSEDRRRLMTRAAFDPATFGRARLHNDNEGVVRAYLAARWLQRLRQENLSQAALFDLLFADSYGVRLVKPSMRETAAWLAILDSGVAREITEREPFLLLSASDPGSLSIEARRTLLRRTADMLVADQQERPLLDRDSLIRFSGPDLSATLRDIWFVHQDNVHVRDLILRIIWLGELTECADMAAEAAYGQHTDRHTVVCAGRALLATGDDAAKNRYVVWLKANLTVVPMAVVWDTIDRLFPKHLGIETLLEILATVDITERDGGLGFDWRNPTLVARLNSVSDLEKLLSGLLTLLGGNVGSLGGYDLAPREEAYFPSIAAAARCILLRCADDEAPALTIDAALRLGEHFRGRARTRDAAVDLGRELRRTQARRRLGFWYAASRLSGHPMLQGRPIQSPWEMEILGWPSGLTFEDIDWLVRDAPLRSAESERWLAVNALLEVWKQTGSDPALLARIEAVAQSDPVLHQAYRAWTQPRQRSQEEIESSRQHEELRNRHTLEKAARDRSWIEFIADLRAKPEQLKELRAPSADGVDARLFGLWRLLSAAVYRENRYAIETIAPLVPILGTELAAAARDAFIDHWRAWNPQLKSGRDRDKRMQINSLELIGLAGVTLEAKRRPDWAERLSPAEARRATAYSTLEINGFPDWLRDLAAAQEEAVADVLMGEVVAELEDPWEDAAGLILHDLEDADARLPELMAPRLVDELARRSGLALRPLSRVLNVIRRGLGDETQLFTRLALERFNGTKDIEVSGLYLSALFVINPATATEALFARLDSLTSNVQSLLVQEVLPVIFGDHFSRGGIDMAALPFDCLERIVHLAYRTIRVTDDNRRLGGVYSPDGRDRAEDARNAAFNRLLKTPGRATYNALLRLTETPDFSVPPSRMRALAYDRAAEDAESAPWPPADLVAFEQSFETAPRTPKELNVLALRRLADIEYDLLNSDFAQGAVVWALPDETAVQNWLAERLRLGQGRSFSVHREEHVVDEKEPDIRLRARATGATIAIEIKVAERWTVKQLEEALTDQLCGQYLRARDALYGILLLVHKKPRRRGWELPVGGGFLTFTELVARLKALAVELAGAPSDAPQPEIAVVDVSSCAPIKRSRKPRNSARTSKASLPKREARRKMA
jgi:hypothetical protein